MSTAALTSHAATRAIATLGAPRMPASQARANAALAAPGALATSAAQQAPRDPRTRAREQAVEFEAVFLNSMFNQMFTAIDGDGPFGGSGGAGVWRSFLTDEYSRSFARSGGIGIADHVYRALLNQQEARAATPAR